jgi:dCMP deaminase
MTVTRISKDEWAILLAGVTSMRSTCLRKQVGCVLLNARGHVLATGYNGAASGLKHCNEPDGDRCFHCGAQFAGSNACLSCGYVHLGEEQWQPQGPDDCPSEFCKHGRGKDDCAAIHAEANALLQCRDIFSIEKCYVTRSPCETCAKLLLNTSCKEIVYRDESSHPSARIIWTSAGRIWRMYRPKTA